MLAEKQGREFEGCYGEVAVEKIWKMWRNIEAFLRGPEFLAAMVREASGEIRGWIQPRDSRSPCWWRCQFNFLHPTILHSPCCINPFRVGGSDSLLSFLLSYVVNMLNRGVSGRSWTITFLLLSVLASLFTPACAYPPTSSPVSHCF